MRTFMVFCLSLLYDILLKPMERVILSTLTLISSLNESIPEK